MAPAAKLVARTIESDPGFMLLYNILKFTDGQVPSQVFDKVSTAMGLTSASAAQQRFARLVKAQEGASGDSPGTQGQTSATPKKRAAGGGQKRKEAPVDADGDSDAEKTPSKRQKPMFLDVNGESVQEADVNVEISNENGIAKKIGTAVDRKG